jgi:hypothetical protein
MLSPEEAGVLHALPPAERAAAFIASPRKVAIFKFKREI